MHDINRLAFTLCSTALFDHLIYIYILYDLSGAWSLSAGCVFTCLEHRGSAGRHAVDLQELSGPAASHDVEPKPSGTFREQSVNREASQLQGLVREPWGSPEIKENQKHREGEKITSRGKW